MEKIKVAILDDYQNITHNFADWNSLSDKIDLKIFYEYIGNDNNLAEQLKDYDVLCLMRERTPLPKELINKLPNLKLVITSGMWNASIDTDALKERNIVYCGTDTKIHSTAELAWALIMNSWRGLQTEIENMKNGNWQTTVGRGLKGNTLGIFGLGKQGLQVANFAKAFDMRVIAWSHNLKKEDCKKANVEYVSSSDLFKMSDILNKSELLTYSTLAFSQSSFFKLWIQAIILMLKALPKLATCKPCFPRPKIPKVFPFKPLPTVDCQLPFFMFSISVCNPLQLFIISAHANSAVE